MRVHYITEEGDELIDFKTLHEVSGLKRTTLHRRLKKSPRCLYLKYKNQFLYKWETLFLIWEEELFRRLDKIEPNMK